MFQGQRFDWHGSRSYDCSERSLIFGKPLTTSDHGPDAQAQSWTHSSLVVLTAAVVALAIATVGFIVYAWRPAIAPTEPPAPSSFDPNLVARGGELAAIGDCVTCHTAPGGKPFSGGLPLGTPFGTIYTPNITRDVETGIGSWSEAAFLRGMREGVSRKGNHLYPAFPYDHFTLVTNDDVRAIYAFLMTRVPVHQRAPETKLPFPLNLRMILAGWKMLFFREGPFQPDSTKDATWNRGFYLVEGLGHCGSCHTPRNILGAEKNGEQYAGGEAEGWVAYPINAASPARVPWDVESITRFLEDGSFETHGVAYGAMTPVIANLARVPHDDVRAIATYVTSLMRTRSRPTAGEAADLTSATATKGNGSVPASAGSQIAPVELDGNNGLGGAVYAAACATCHQSRRPPPYGGVDLHLSSAINATTPQNAINLVLFGIPAAKAVPSGMMPGLAGSLTDGQVAALLTYLRKRFSGKPAWSGIPDFIEAARQGSAQVRIRSADGADQTPVPAGGR